MLNRGYLVINTTLPIGGVDFAVYFLEQIETLFGTNDFMVVWTDPATDKRKAVRRAKCDGELLAKLQAGGGLAVEGERGADWSAGLSWHRYARTAATIEGVPRGFTPNQITMALPEALMREGDFLTRLQRAMASLCVQADADYGAVRPWLRANTRFARSPLGHAAGLEGIYWLNYFGPAYVRLIGLDQLLAAPGAVVEQLGPLACLMRLGDAYFSVDVADRSARVREHLGDAYFLKPAPTEESGSGVSSGSLLDLGRVFGFVSSLVKERRVSEAELAQAADRRPQFDFQRMYEHA
jgi:hypothetical protein